MFTHTTIAASLAAAAVAGGSPWQARWRPPQLPNAATPIVKKGDILVPTYGTIFNGGGIDKIDPVTRIRSRAASFGVNDATNDVAAAPDGDFFVGNQDGRVRKVDAATGAQTTIKFPFSEFGVALDDLAVGADGSPIGLINEETGTVWSGSRAERGDRAVRRRLSGRSRRARRRARRPGAGHRWVRPAADRPVHRRAEHVAAFTTDCHRSRRS